MRPRAREGNCLSPTPPAESSLRVESTTPSGSFPRVADRPFWIPESRRARFWSENWFKEESNDGREEASEEKDEYP